MQKHLSLIENDGADPMVNVLRKIALAWGVSANELLGIKQELEKVEWRTIAGMTCQWGFRQGEVVKLAGISQKQMSQFESNKRPGVRTVTITKIVQVFHVSTDYLLGLKEEENGEQRRETTTTKT